MWKVLPRRKFCGEVALPRGRRSSYGLKGKLGNWRRLAASASCFCGRWPPGDSTGSVTARAVEDRKPPRTVLSDWRLACQATVRHSVVGADRPQLGLPMVQPSWKRPLAAPLPAGPTRVPSAGDT